MGPPGCCICFEDFSSDENLQGIGSCGHVFHTHCLQQWLETSNHRRCPLCRVNCSKVYNVFLTSVGAQDSPPNSPTKAKSSSRSTEADQDIETKKLIDKGKFIKSLQRLCEEKDGQIKLLQNTLEAAEAAKSDAIDAKTCLQQQVDTERKRQQALVTGLQKELNEAIAKGKALNERNSDLEKIVADCKMRTFVNIDKAELNRHVQLALKHSHTEDVICSLQRTLLERNRMYTDLVKKCSQLGSAQSIAAKRNEVAAERMKKLKMRVDILERENARLLSFTASTNVVKSSKAEPRAILSSALDQQSASIPGKLRTTSGQGISKHTQIEPVHSAKSSVNSLNLFTIIDGRHETSKKSAASNKQAGGFEGRDALVLATDTEFSPIARKLHTGLVSESADKMEIEGVTDDLLAELEIEICSLNEMGDNGMAHRSIGSEEISQQISPGNNKNLSENYVADSAAPTSLLPYEQDERADVGESSPSKMGEMYPVLFSSEDRTAGNEDHSGGVENRAPGLISDPIIIRKEYGLSGASIGRGETQNSGLSDALGDHGLLGFGGKPLFSPSSADSGSFISCGPDGRGGKRKFIKASHLGYTPATAPKSLQKRPCTNLARKDSGMTSINSYFTRER